MKQSDLSNPVALAKIIAASNANTIPVDTTNTSYASQTEGFPAITMKPKSQGGEAPHGMDFNGFMKLLSSHVFNIQNGAPETFNPEVSNLIGGYPKNAQLWLINDNNSRLLKSTKDDNTDNFLTTPSVIGTSWVDAFPTKDYVDNNFVTTNTTQIITGSKTFSGLTTLNARAVIKGNATTAIDLYQTDVTKGTAPSNPEYGAVHFLDKNGNFLASTEYGYADEGNTSARLMAYGPNNEYARLGVNYPASGKPYTMAPTPTDTTSGSGTQIATTGWVNTVGNSVVHLNGTETISGTKTFKENTYITGNDRALVITNTGITRGTAPTTTVYPKFIKLNGSNDTFGNIEIGYDTARMIRVNLLAYNGTSTSDTSPASLSVINKSGTKYATCNASDVDGSIVTTVAKSKAANGYFKLGNGLIVQWGRASAGGTVTLPAAFTSANYKVVLTRYNVNTKYHGGSYITAQYTTSFTFNGADANTEPHNWIAIGY